MCRRFTGAMSAPRRVTVWDCSRLGAESDIVLPLPPAAAVDRLVLHAAGLQLLDEFADAVLQVLDQERHVRRPRGGRRVEVVERGVQVRDEEDQAAGPRAE